VFRLTKIRGPGWLARPSFMKLVVGPFGSSTPFHTPADSCSFVTCVLLFENCHHYLCLSFGVHSRCSSGKRPQVFLSRFSRFLGFLSLGSAVFCGDLLTSLFVESIRQRWLRFFPMAFLNIGWILLSDSGVGSLAAVE